MSFLRKTVLAATMSTLAAPAFGQARPVAEPPAAPRAASSAGRSAEIPAALIAARGPSDVAALIAAIPPAVPPAAPSDDAPSEAGRAVAMAAALGVAVPEDVAEAAVSDGLPADARARVIAAAVDAAPRRAERVAAFAIAARPGALAAIRPFAYEIGETVIAALFAADISAAEKEAEAIEVLTVIDAFAGRPAALRLAAIVAALTPAADDAGSLVAAIGVGPETGAIAPPGLAISAARRPLFVVAPSSPAQDAPSAN